MLKKYINKYITEKEIQNKLKKTIKKIWRWGEEGDLPVFKNFIDLIKDKKFDSPFDEAKYIIKNLNYSKCEHLELDSFLIILDESGVEAWQMVSTTFRLLPSIPGGGEKLHNKYLKLDEQA